MSDSVPIPLIPVLLGTLGGVVAGALLRQPEINRLRKQVQVLQAEIQRLQALVEEQNRQIQELTVRYKTLKAWSFVEKAKQRARLEGAVMHQWAFKEYVELLCAQASERPLSEEERAFFNAYENLLAGLHGDKDERLIIRNYIRSKYRHEIERLVTVDASRLVASVEAVNVA